MKEYLYNFVITIFLLINIQCQAERENDPAKLKVGYQEDGTVVIPTNQVLDPAGFQITFPGRPTDIAVSPDEKILAVKNRQSIILIDLIKRSIIQELFMKTGGQSYSGILFDSDGKRVYSSASPGEILIAEIDDNNVANWLDPIKVAAFDGSGNSVPGGMAWLKKNQILLAAISRNNTLALIDVNVRRVLKEITVGVAPFTVIVVGGKAYVSNWGGRIPKSGESTALSSGTPTLVNPKTGIANSGTISVVDLETFTVEKEITVGLHPTAMIPNNAGSRVFVTNTNSDFVSVIDTKIDEVVENISTAPSKDLPFGSSPNALAITKNNSRLFIANGTNNAIAVVDLGARAGNVTGELDSKISGFIPVGWYPGAAKLIFDESQMIVANIKGLGSLNQRADRHGLNSHDHLGSISIFKLPGKDGLNKYTKQFYKLNRLPETLTELAQKPAIRNAVPVPEVHGEQSVFKHVLYIIKENRTYDQVFGDLPQGNGDSTLCMFGREVTPNHHALAEEFVLLDNFYCSGILSADGHQWTDEAFVTSYLERFFGRFARSYPYEGDDPLAFASSGFIWDNVISHGLTFRNYGEMVKAHISPSGGTFLDIYNDFKNGMKKYTIRATTSIKNMEPYLCPTAIGFPGIVPDVYRAGEFIKELRKFELEGKFPNFIIMLLPNDHTMGTRPGAPTPRAQVADNDLALGQIVEAVSKSIFWKETVIFVVEDDPQAGLDHVDGHRTVALCISPYTKRGEVISVNYTQISMVKTIELILGIPPMNQFDLAANPMKECFQERPNYSPYTARRNNIPLDEMNPPLSILKGPARYWAEKSLALDLEDIDRADEDTFNRILWHYAKGYDVPYPD